MRRKKLVNNTVSSLVFQVTSIVCGFVLPRLILSHYGSQINGLVTSITQFLEMIAFLELGVGAVVQSNLYKPLAENDYQRVSEIITSAQKFFSSLARILVVYIVVLIAIYPLLIKKEYTFLYTGLLIIAISISLFAQYYFGIVDRLLLTADQRGYIQYNCQTITLIINTIACAILIDLGASIHIVKITTSLLFLCRPIYLRYYVNHHYTINRNAKYEKEPISQKWNGVAQHIAAVVLDGTDSIVLTALSSLENVSIYYVYSLVLTGVKKLLISMTNGIQALLGELWARQENEELNKTFGWVEWALHSATVFIFGCTGTLIMPFISVYTKGVNDANYIYPLFAFLITSAHGGHCLRLPYNIMILAAGHYKRTQKNYIVAAILNITISVICVSYYGLIGVAIGTLVAMLYQTMWMALYLSNNILKWPFRCFLKQIAVDLLSIGVGAFISYYAVRNVENYIEWLTMAVYISLIWITIVILINSVFYKQKILVLIEKIKQRFA